MYSGYGGPLILPCKSVNPSYLGRYPFLCVLSMISCSFLLVFSLQQSLVFLVLLHCCCFSLTLLSCLLSLSTFVVPGLALSSLLSPATALILFSLSLRSAQCASFVQRRTAPRRAEEEDRRSLGYTLSPFTAASRKAPSLHIHVRTTLSLLSPFRPSFPSPARFVCCCRRYTESLRRRRRKTKEKADDSNTAKTGRKKKRRRKAPQREERERAQCGELYYTYCTHSSV